MHIHRFHAKVMNTMDCLSVNSNFIYQQKNPPIPCALLFSIWHYTQNMLYLSEFIDTKLNDDVYSQQFPKKGTSLLTQKKCVHL